ncbi:MAG: ABC transporter permease subunit [Pseudomonadota bacterium]
MLFLTRPRPDIPPIVERRLALRLWRHRGGRAGLVLGALLLLFALCGAVWTPHDADVPNYANALKPPSLSHPFGTDATGRDMLSRVMDGAQRSIGAAMLALSAVFAIGLTLGILAALVGGLTDILIMRVVDIAMTMPPLVLGFAVLGLLGPGLYNLLLAVIIAEWAYYARLARALSLDARHRPHVVAARLAGVPGWRIVSGHILPGVALHLGIVATLQIGVMISIISGFSFLGLGVQPPKAEWGALLAESRLFFAIAPWLLIAPAMAIFVSVLSANLLGNALRDTVGPGARP